MLVISLFGLLVIGLACSAFESVWAVTGALECNVLCIKRAFAKQVSRMLRAVLLIDCSLSVYLLVESRIFRFRSDGE